VAEIGHDDRGIAANEAACADGARRRLAADGVQGRQDLVQRLGGHRRTGQREVPLVGLTQRIA